MGSTLLALRNLLEFQCSLDPTDTDTDPTSTLLNKYINLSIRKIIRVDRPREYLAATPVTADATSGQNSVTLPTGILVPDTIWYNYDGTNYKQLFYKELKDMIQDRGAYNFFNSSLLGYPDFYCVRGTSIVFDRYIKTTVSGGFKVYGVTPPTALSLDADTTGLPEDYDSLIVYEAASMFYQKENEDDGSSLSKFVQLAKKERDELRLALMPDETMSIRMDPTVFSSYTTSISNPDIFYQS